MVEGRVAETAESPVAVDIQVFENEFGRAERDIQVFSTAQKGMGVEIRMGREDGVDQRGRVFRVNPALLCSRNGIPAMTLYPLLRVCSKQRQNFTDGAEPFFIPVSGVQLEVAGKEKAQSLRIDALRNARERAQVDGESFSAWVKAMRRALERAEQADRRREFSAS